MAYLIDFRLTIDQSPSSWIGFVMKIPAMLAGSGITPVFRALRQECCGMTQEIGAAFEKSITKYISLSISGAVGFTIENENVSPPDSWF